MCVMKVPIELRSVEQSQLEEFTPRAADRLENKGLDEEAQEVRDAEIIDNGDGTYSAETTEWSALIGALRTLRDGEGLRSWWLRKKLAIRLSSAVEEMKDTKEAAEGGSDDATPRVDASKTTSEVAV